MTPRADRVVLPVVVPRVGDDARTVTDLDLEAGRRLQVEAEHAVVVMTTESDKKTGRPTTPGSINGGFYKKDKSDQHPSVVIAVDDVKAYTKKVVAMGGKLLGEPVDIPHVGWYVSFIDTEGNKVSILQPSPEM